MDQETKEFLEGLESRVNAMYNAALRAAEIGNSAPLIFLRSWLTGIDIEEKKVFPA